MIYRTKAGGMTADEIEEYAKNYMAKWTGSKIGGTAQRAFVLAEGVLILARKLNRLQEELRLIQSLKEMRQ